MSLFNLEALYPTADLLERVKASGVTAHRLNGKVRRLPAAAPPERRQCRSLCSPLPPPPPPPPPLPPQFVLKGSRRAAASGASSAIPVARVGSAP